MTNYEIIAYAQKDILEHFAELAEHGVQTPVCISSYPLHDDLNREYKLTITVTDRKAEDEEVPF